jgi:TRAP transporter TAXI family solute receptor
VKGLRLAALSISAAGAIGGCVPAPSQEATTTLRIATGSSDGVYYSVGHALAAAYSRLPGVSATAEVRENPVLNVEEIQRGAADLTFDGAGHAYFAFKHGTDADNRPHARLRAIAVLFSTAVQIAARKDAHVRSIADFRGRRVAVGSRDSSNEQTTRVILERHGLNLHDVTPVFGAGREIVSDMRDGKLDGVFLFTPLQHAVMSELTASVDVRLVPISRDRIADIQEGSPFLKTTVIPAGTYPGQPEAVTTVGTDILLLCRDDLPDKLVRDLTRTLFAAVPELSKAHPAAAAIDPDRGPVASIPLHPGAARFYRERELLR